MKRFKTFLIEEVRRGLPHIVHDNPNAPSLISRVSTAHRNLNSLIGSGRIRGHITEKSDGSAFEVGHDDNGFYSRSSHSEKMRNKGDYLKAAKKKFKDAVDPTISGHFDKLHHILHSNEKLQQLLQNQKEKHGKGQLKGEIFYRPMGVHSKDGKQVTFIGTKYNTNHMGEVGSFIVHSHLPENQHHSMNSLQNLNDKNITFQHDMVEVPKIDIDVSDEKQRLDKLSPNIIRKKHTHYNEMVKIAKDVQAKVINAVQKNKPKWGTETEGYVIHPEIGSNAPRIKVIDTNFISRKNSSKFGK